MPSVTYQLTNDQIKDLKEMLCIDPKPIPYAHYRGRYKGHVITAYQSGKVLIQGKDPDTIVHSLAVFEKTPSKKTSSQVQHSSSLLSDQAQSIIGSDENGKGSYTGSLTVCAVYLGKDQREKVISLGVKDSKKLSDQTILQLSPKLREILLYSCIEITPHQYNQLHLNQNINEILAKSHHHVLSDLYQKVLSKHLPLDRLIVDQFLSQEKFMSLATPQQTAYKSILTCQVKAEDHYLAVACASIIAREAFLKSLKRLGQTYGVALPSGAGAAVDSHIAKLAQIHGLGILDQLTKMHFANTEKVKKLLG
ncbi:ribonuclease HIII [Atopobacter sp. AH10]|uniref:ribonuclease HIII n=1 Tax=Atopobacter sp. AH10 TaxID=2315861 RepID=UPI000EF1EB41|nr:ribonuclease HIII [Atopobacter sp. AH10]RLK63956.1 ribonuclease HIII [Atopobacter sp. AH10]